MLEKKASKLHRILKGLAIAAFWIAIWQFASMIVNQPLFVPSPLETLVSLGALVVSSEFWLSVLMTFYRVVFGLVVSFVLGLAFAYLSSHFKTVESMLSPFVSAIKSTPIMSIIILALVWFQASFVPVFSCILLCFPIFYTNTLSGIKSVDKKYLEFGQKFEDSYIRQGIDEDRTIYDSMERGWELLSVLPRAELVRVKEEQIDKYLSKVLEE